MSEIEVGSKVRIVAENTDKLPLGAEGTVTEIVTSPSGWVYAMTEFPEHEDEFGSRYAVRVEKLELIEE